MICARCAAADNGAPSDEHCADPTCTCGHRAPSRPATDAADVPPLDNATVIVICQDNVRRFQPGAGAAPIIYRTGDRHA